MSDQWTDRLSAYLDDELKPDDCAAVESHLANCEECRVTLDQLKRVTGWAKSYPGREPARDAWPGIAAAIENTRPGVVNLDSRRPRKRWRLLQLPHALAAGIALTLVGAGSWWIARATAPERSMAAVIDV